MEEHWVERAGARLFVAELGQGTPVVLLHGGLAHHQACLRFAAPLADRMRLVLPDLRGSGRSIWRAPLDWDLLADDVAAIAAAFGIERAAVGGTSFGAGCAVRVALRHPRLVAGLLVLNPAYGGAELGFTAAQAAAMNAIAAAGREALVSGIGAFDPLLEGLPAEMREAARATVRGYDAESVAATTAFMASGAQPFGRAEELGAIGCPTLVVPGVDPTHPREVAEVFAKGIAGAEIVETEDYAAAINAFVGRRAV